MREQKISSLLIYTITLLLVTAVGLAAPKGKRVTVKGEVVDLWCYLEAGDRGQAKKACATACAKAGNPIAILDEKGGLYLTAGLRSHQAATDLFIDKMSEAVTVSGVLVKKGGMQMIYVDTVK